MDAIQTVVDRIQNTITAPDERDKQTRIGPSALGKQCEWCLGNAMVNGDEPKFVHAAWLGTCVHLWLEQNETFSETRKELRVEVGEIPGYGPIGGTCDRFDGDVVVATDYKTSSKKNARRLKNGYVTRGGQVEIIDQQLLEYYVQVQAYGLGAENAGFKPEFVMLYIIPRDSTSISDHVWLPFEYNPDIVHAYLARAGEIYAWAQEHGVNSLEVDPECWSCMREGRE